MKKSRNNIHLPPNPIVLPWSTYTESGLREVDLEPSHKRGSDKTNKEKQRRKTQKNESRVLQPGLTYGSQDLQR